VRLCEVAPDEFLDVLKVFHIEALVDINWRQIQQELERVAEDSEAFRRACAGCDFKDDVPESLTDALIPRA
jgi:hypothetical protein